MAANNAKISEEEKDRSRNLILYGLEEKKDEQLEKVVLEVLSELDEKPRIVSCSRLGQDQGEENQQKTCKPVRVSLSGTDHVRQILRKTTKLRAVEGYTKVYICPDRTPEQRASHKKLVEELKKKRTSEPGKKYFIRNNKIILSDTCNSG